jgi:hypothetical protein
MIVPTTKTIHTILIEFSLFRKKLATNATRNPPINGTVMIANPNHIKAISPIESNMLITKPAARIIRVVFSDLFD